MLQTTKEAVTAIVRTDPSIIADQLKAALRALAGESAPLTVADAPMDKGLTRNQVAEILGVNPHTVSNLANRGRIHKICLGKSATRATRYSAESVKALLAHGKGVR